MNSDDPRFDLFISYAHADNKDEWISRFVEEIQSTYKEISLQNLTVFFDKTSI